MDNPLQYFSALTDPRVERNREHLLEEILLIAIAAVLSGAESWNDIAEYGEDKLEWLKTFLTLPGGIPSHDTFNRVFAALDPEEMEQCFASWVSSIAKLTAGEVVAIDGKTLCGTRESGKKTLVHMVSAWAETNGLVLGQRKVDAKSNEITAIPNPTPNDSTPSSASTGALRTNCTGCWTWISMKTFAVNEPETPPRTSPSSSALL